MVREHERKGPVPRSLRGWESNFEFDHIEIVGRRVRTGCIWLRLVPVAVMNVGTFGFHKQQGTFWLAGQLIASQDLVDFQLCITVEQGNSE